MMGLVLDLLVRPPPRNYNALDNNESTKKWKSDLDLGVKVCQSIRIPLRL